MTLRQAQGHIEQGRNMKVALVHDYIKEFGGAERVLEALHEVYPDAPVYTSVYHPKFLGPHRQRFKDWDIRTSWLQHIPFSHKLISPLRLLAPFVFQSFDFSQYDVVIVSATGAFESNMIRTKNSELRTKKPVHVCYCHTPPRYLYGYATAREWKNNVVFRALGEFANHFLRMVDFTASQRVDYFIANSEEVKGRIKKFYRKDAVVIYPPVDAAFSKIASSVQLGNQKLNAKRYFLAGGRLARPKHIDLIVRACRELDVPLKVFGKAFAGYGDELKELGGSKTEFVGEVSDEEKLELMQNAKAYIFASEDEDFGITPVEAMACGTPVIAYRSGGVLESVIEGKTGLFFDELTVESLKKTIKHFDCSNDRITSENCRRQAQKFSKERFKKEMKAFIEKLRFLLSSE